MIRIILLIIIFDSCAVKERMPDNTFDDYIGSFLAVNLPLSLNREKLFALNATVYDTVTNVYKLNEYPIIDEKFNTFLPPLISKELTTKRLRSIYRFEVPPNLSVIVAVDSIFEDEQKGLSLLLINYSKNGDILDYMELAGYTIDTIEKFVIIDNNGKISKRSYIFKDKLGDINPSNLTYAEETTITCEINNHGKLVRLSQSSRVGYFLGTNSGYDFKEPLR